MTSSPTSADIGAKTDPITRGALSHKLACSSHRRTTTWRFESWNGGRRSRAGCTPSWTPPKSGGAQPSARQAREQLALLALSARIDDTSLLDDIERNTDELEERSRERTRADRPPAPTPRPIILTVRAGAGGRDAQAFAARLLRMYVRYAQRTRTRHTLLHAEHTDAGTRSATLRVHPRPGQRWHTEHGVHRITHLSGVGSGRGRRHTSFVAVEALEEPAPAETPTIAREAVRIDVFRGSGPGGQHRNATESSVRIRHIESGITAVCAGARSQHANYEAAMRILVARLTERDRRAAESARARARRDRAPAGFGHHVRTYRMERDSVQDNARGVRVSGANTVLEGDLARLWRAQRTKSR